MATAAYEEPDWSAPPPASAEATPFRLEIMKEGVIIGEVPLEGRNFFLLGRQHDIVHIPMDHMSISRRHAVLNFRNDGALMLRDLGSAQGTRLNKQPCQPDTYHRVYVGDLLQFGASTRKYIVAGPCEQERQEYDSENLERMRRLAEDKSARLREKQRRQEEADSSASWGMRDYEDEDAADAADAANADADDDDDAGKGKGRRDESGKNSRLPEYLRNDEHYDRKFGDKFAVDIKDTEAKNKKDEELVEKIRKKERKVQNMQEENRRIFMKENSQDGGLTEGQLKAVDRNDKAILQLKADIESLVKQIRSKNLQRDLQTEGRSGKKRSAREALEEADDVLDTTTEHTADAGSNWRIRRNAGRNRDGATAEVAAAAAAAAAAMGDDPARALTYAEISAQLESAAAALAAVQSQLSAVRANEFAAQAKTAQHPHATAGVEEIDRLMAQEELKDIQLQRQRLEGEDQKMQLQLRGLQQLQKVAAPALKPLATEKKAADQHRPLDANHQQQQQHQQQQPIVEPNVTGSEDDLKSAVSAAGGSDGTGPTTDEIKCRASTVHTASNAHSKTASVISNDEETVELTPAEKLRMLQREIEAEKKREEEEQQRKKQERIAAERSAAAAATPAAAAAAAPVRGATASAAAQVKSAAGAKSAKSKAAAKAPRDPSQLEGGDFVWVPPSNQRGDGKTSLNEKLGY